ncbi:hypothetical protein [Streptomyces virginiae]|uniref:hypothetical protein n=1 Tax=Streptomyces virginiae TaxID=1961 RepID=UPI0036800D18
MGRDARRAAVRALDALARSDEWRDRADAGHGLAAFAEMPEAVGPLLRLVAGDTLVTRRTVQSLLRRMDGAGLSVVASAMAVADARHGDWIHTAVLDVFGIHATDRDEALRVCEGLTRDADARVAEGARRLAEDLARIDPVLHPVRWGEEG